MSIANRDHEIEYQDAKTAYKHCAIKMRELKACKKFYIGATPNPDSTLQDLTINMKMKNMFVLCKVPTENKTISIMKKLAHVFGKQKNCVNNYEKDENEHFILDTSNYDNKENYIYILFK